MAWEWRNKPGFLGTLEGCEGGGKTTQLSLLATRLVEELGFPAEKILRNREPGGTKIGDKIRGVILDMSSVGMTPLTEFMLFSASRAQLVSQEIVPALNIGCLFLLDRYFDSSLAYQGWGHGLPIGDLRYITRVATKGIVPDVTYLLDLDPSIGINRKNLQNEANRFEDAMEMEFHNRARKGFLNLAKNEPDRFVVIDASMAEADIHEIIWNDIVGRLTSIGMLGMLQSNHARQSVSTSRT